jgi:hypothetical protein
MPPLKKAGLDQGGHVGSVGFVDGGWRRDNTYLASPQVALFAAEVELHRLLQMLGTAFKLGLSSARQCVAD